MSSQNQNVYQFGRDLSLKNDYMDELCKKYAGMSWSEMCYAIEEEEELKECEKTRENNKKQDKERKNLYTNGDYDLEEGEIFE